MAVDPVLPSEGPPSDDTISKENENNIIQIIFVNTESGELGGNLSVPLQQEEKPPVHEVYSAIYPVPPPSNLIVFFDWNQLARPRPSMDVTIYIYSMEAIVSTLFRVMCFPHEGQLVQLVDQLSFPGSNTAMNQPSSLYGLFVSTMSLQPSFHPPNYRK